MTRIISSDQSAPGARIERLQPVAGRSPRAVAPGSDRDGDSVPTWWDGAACSGLSTELFFPIGTTDAALRQTAEAKLVCASCSVRSPCLAYALATTQLFGIFGGTTEEERRSARKRLRVS